MSKDSFEVGVINIDHYTVNFQLNGRSNTVGMDIRKDGEMEKQILYFEFKLDKLIEELKTLYLNSPEQIYK